MKKKQTVTIEYPCTEITEEGDRLVLTFTSGHKKAVIKVSLHSCSLLSRKIGHCLAARVRTAQAILDATEKSFHRGVEAGKNGED